MSQFKPMETSSLITCEVLFENVLDEVDEVLVNVLLKLHSNSLGRNINLSDDVWMTILTRFDLIS